MASQSKGTTYFYLKNVLTEQYITHRTEDSTYILTEKPSHKSMFKFIQVDGIWGYLVGIAIHTYMGPEGESANTQRNLVLLKENSKPGRHNLFAIDQINDRIIHIDGLTVQYRKGTDRYPPDGDNICLSSSIHEGMKWTLVYTDDESYIVNPYSPPKISGDWKMIYAVINPLAKQTRTFKTKVGKCSVKSTSISQAVTKSSQFSWEDSSSKDFSFSFFVSLEHKSSHREAGTEVESLKNEISNASSATWNQEVEMTDTVEVEPGKSVVIWQRKFTAKGDGHKAVFMSNIFAQTQSIDKKPGQKIRLNY